MKLKVTQKRSLIGSTKIQRENLRTLGLRPKIGHSVCVANTAEMRGKIKKILHLVTVEEVKA